jgi:hypothetical protein
MPVDGNIGGAIDGTGGDDLAGMAEQVGAAERVGYDGVWTTEVSRDPFLPLLLARLLTGQVQMVLSYLDWCGDHQRYSASSSGASRNSPI